MTNLRHTISLEAEIRTLKDRTKELEAYMYQHNIAEGFEALRKLAKIENWYARTQGQVTHESALEMVQILKENNT